MCVCVCVRVRAYKEEQNIYSTEIWMVQGYGEGKDPMLFRKFENASDT
jgi:hypothetical protein